MEHGQEAQRREKEIGNTPSDSAPKRGALEAAVIPRRKPRSPVDVDALEMATYAIFRRCDTGEGRRGRSEKKVDQEAVE